MKDDFRSRVFELLPFNKIGTILLGYRGSMAHGTYIPDMIDDKDVMGAAMPPENYVLGLDRYEQTERQVDEIDLVVYDFRKYIRLLLANNPNVMSLLWLEDKHYLLRTDLGHALIEMRHLFPSKLCYKTYGGYAVSQMRRMERFDFKGYMGQKRKELVVKYGYDTKNASHLIRLLRMGIEVLTTGQVNV